MNERRVACEGGAASQESSAIAPRKIVFNATPALFFLLFHYSERSSIMSPDLMYGLIFFGSMLAIGLIAAIRMAKK
jgi:hypothetical protein